MAITPPAISIALGRVLFVMLGAGAAAIALAIIFGAVGVAAFIAFLPPFSRTRADRAADLRLVAVR